MSKDPVLESFLAKQRDESIALSSASDLLTLVPSPGEFPTHYVAQFRARGLVRIGSQEPTIAEEFAVGVQFPRDYLRFANPARVLTWLGPTSVFHPNVRAPFVCIGPIAPGTSITELSYRLYDLITFNSVTPREDDALNAAACLWARRHWHRFPIDRRPLKWTAS